MKLTGADKAAIKSVLSEKRFTQVMAMDAQLFLAGKRAGREDMRERAAAECDHFQSLSASHKCGACMAGVIRALGVDDE